MSTHIFSPKLMSGYDVRGVYGDVLHDEDAYYIGRCIASYAHAGHTIGVGRDYRPSTPSLYENLVKGINSLGVHVADLGCVPTPVLYHTVRTHSELCGGVMITGSHNDLRYNGFKIMLRDREISGSELKSFSDLGHALPNLDVRGSVRPLCIIDEYVQFLLRHVQNTAFITKKVLWSTSGGVAEEVLQKLMPFLPAQHQWVKPPLDQRAPDPLIPDNRTFMREMMCKEDADLGLAFDGDADRCVVFDRHGEPLLADQIFLFMVDRALRVSPGATFVADSKVALSLKKHIEQRGGSLLYVPTGHTNIKAAMRTSGAVFGGEMSGHYFFPYGGGHAFDDGIYAAVQILNMMGADTWDTIQDELPALHVTEEIRVPIGDDALARLHALWSDAASESEHIPGGAFRYHVDDGWIFIRKSRTEALISMRAEGKSADSLLRLKQNVCAMFAKETGSSDALFRC